jgi:group I intron endonuclease
MTSSGTYTVYKVINNVNGKFYIGITSRCVQLRWKEHIRHAKRKTNNGSFYKAIRKYGYEMFTVEVLSFCKKAEDAKQIEIKLISDLKPHYNSTLGGDGTLGHKLTANSRKKISIANTGNKYNLGRKWSDEQRLAMSKKKIGCKAPPVTEKMILNRVKNFLTASYKRRRKVICVNDNQKFNSIKDAAKNYNLDKTTVSAICNGRRKAAYGLQFNFAEAA